MKRKKNKYKIVIVLCIFLGLCLERVFNSRYFINVTMVKYNGILQLGTFLITLCSLISIYILLMQLRAEHEKCRREKACELLLVWSQELKRETNAAKKIVEKFTKEQCRKLFLEEKFKVPCRMYVEILEVTNTKSTEATAYKTNRRNYRSSLNGNNESLYNKNKVDFDCKDCKTAGNDENYDCENEFELTKEQIKKLRHLIITYLNLLESILVAWQYSIADREIIEDQFSYLVSPKEGHNVLEDFRIASGSQESYPAIEIFCSHLESKSRERLKEKGNIV